MNPRSTWLWLVVAIALFGGIYFFHPPTHQSPTATPRVLPQLHAGGVTSIQVRPKGKLAIVAIRTNGLWQLVEPVQYPAQAASIDGLLTALEQMTRAAYLTARERQAHPKADEEDGLAQPQTTIIVQQGDYQAQLWLGSKTPPGDQLFLQTSTDVEGGVCVVDAELLKFIPKSADDWRDTTFVSLGGLAFDRLSVSNSSTVFEIQRDATNRLWRLSRPLQARANSSAIEDALKKLEAVRIQEFVSDGPKIDLESLGLQPPECELELFQQTNVVALLQFGKSPTNQPAAVYARRAGKNTLVTVAREALTPWRISVNELRDPHLLALTAPVDVIEIRGEDRFTLQRQTNDTWRVMPQNFPADAGLVRELLGNLSELKVAEFVKQVVTDPDLPAYGLATPPRQYVLRTTVPNGAGGQTNIVLAPLDFGTNQNDKVFVRRADETSVCAVKGVDFRRLLSASWQFRERKIWNFSEEEVARVTVRQENRSREMLRTGPHQWSIAPGSQGVINDLAVEETVRGLGHLSAAGWVAHGEGRRAEYGLTDRSLRVSLELKNGEKPLLELGAAPYAAVVVDGEPWVLQMPELLYRDVLSYLSISETP